MKWDEYYQRFYDWAESTARRRIYDLEDFGDPQEIIEVAESISDEKAVARLLKKAVESGTIFSADQTMEILLNIPEDVIPTLVLSASGVFTAEQ